MAFVVVADAVDFVPFAVHRLYRQVEERHTKINIMFIKIITKLISFQITWLAYVCPLTPKLLLSVVLLC